MYGDLASYLYSRISSTWLKNVSIGACGSYCIDLVFCSRSIRWLGDIFTVRENKILDEHEEGAYELAIVTVPHGCDIFFFYGQ